MLASRPLSPLAQLGMLVIVVSSSALGCVEAFGSEEAQQGTPLGTFHVSATLATNSCGEGALGAEPLWEFDVDLARDPQYVFWNNGAQVLSGPLGADKKSFRIDTSVLVDMRTEEQPGFTPCSIERSDVAAAVLDSDTDEVGGFAGTLAYGMWPTADSQCGDLVVGGSETPLFATLPCAMEYAVTATRTAEPAE